MPTKIACQCGAKFTVRDELAGQEMDCPTCGEKLKVPDKANVVTSRSWATIVNGVTSILIIAAGGAMLYLTTNRVRALEEKSTLLETDADEKKRIDEELDQRLKTAKTERGTLDDKLEAEKTKRQADQHKLEGLTNRAGVLRGDITNLETEITGIINTKDAATQGKLTDLEQQLTAAQQELDETSTVTDALTTQIEVADANIENMQLDIEALESLTKRLEQRKQFDPTNINSAMSLLDGEIESNNLLTERIRQAHNRLFATVQNLQLTAGPTNIYKTTIVRGGPAKEFKTVCAEDKTTSDWYVIRLNTKLGHARVWKNAAPPSSTIIYPITDYVPGTKIPGRFDVKATYKNNGNFYDFVLLDTQMGNAYYSSTGPQWTKLANGQQHPSKPIKNNYWRLDVDMSNSENTAVGPPGLGSRIIVSNTERVLPPGAPVGTSPGILVSADDGKRTGPFLTPMP